MTYEDLIVGKFNEVAIKASRLVLENPGKEYPVLIIQGRLGSGKTHILKAMESILSKESVIKLVNSSQLMNEMVTSMKENAHMSFREKYQNVDVLFVDDLHEIAGRTGTQHETFHIIKNRVLNNKQTVITTSKKISGIREINENLDVFLKSALTVEILNPSLEERFLIAQKIASNKGFSLDEDVAKYIAETCFQNIRAIEGVVLKIKAVNEILKIELGIRTVKEFLSPFQIVDDKYDEAVAIAMERGTISSAYLKNYFKITHKRAKEIIHQMRLENVSCHITEVKRPTSILDHTTIENNP